MNKIEKDESTVLVINGVPYSLVRDLEKADNKVCEKCDLSEDCCFGDDFSLYRKLCSIAPLKEDWYFKIDWDIINKRICDYLDIDHK